MKKDKIVRNLNHKLWQEFAALCLKKKITVGEKINELIKKEVDNNGDKKIRASES